MLTKIISGGKPGAERAALDAAIDLDIPYTGWISKGRKTDDGTLPERYKLKEAPAETDCTACNILESDGILILSHGKRTCNIVLPAELAEKHSRQSLHIDLALRAIIGAGSFIHYWINKHKVKVSVHGVK